MLDVLLGEIFREEQIIQRKFFIAGETLPDIPLFLLIHAVGQIHQIHEGFFDRGPVLLAVVGLDDFLISLIVVNPLGVGKQQLVQPLLDQIVQIFQNEIFPLGLGKFPAEQVKVDLADVKLAGGS